MAYYPYTLMSIISLSYYQFIQTRADPVDIEGSTYKLSTDIVYAIYDKNVNDYLYDAGFSETIEECFYDLFNHKIRDPKETNPKDIAKWKIEKTSHGYAMKNVGSDRYLSQQCEVPDWIGSKSVPSHDNEEGLSWKFASNGEMYYDSPTEQHLPVVNMKESSTNYNSATVQHVRDQCWGGIFIWEKIESRIFRNAVDGCEPSQWVFRPLSLPENCGKPNAVSSDPNAFKQMTTQISSSLSAENRNAGSTEVAFTTPEQEKCETVTTSFTRTEGSENTYGWSIAFQWPQISAGPVSLGGGPSAEYHDDWTKYSETEETKSQEQETCITFPSTDVICPPRTICNREVTTFRPTVDEVEYTITATCDGVNYTTKGKASVKGIVRMRYEDRMVPMDCKYYTTDYNIFKPGTLQFCDTCNNNKTCEICRDGYILLDGVCVTASTCEVTCGGSIRGGKYLEILGGLGPWSGGFCHINDENKYLSDSCREQLGGANATQTAPGPIDDPSIGEDTDTIVLDDLCVLNHAQCGGIGYDGPSKCCQYPNDPREWRCIFMSEWHSQCNPLPN